MTQGNALFQNVPEKDTFHFFKGAEPNCSRVLEVLNFKKEDVAKAADVPLSSVRYDEKMPAELLERMREWALALALVGEFFNDFDKTTLWFRVPNPLLGGIAPRDMIRIGRFKKLLKYIQTALNQNPPKAG